MSKIIAIDLGTGVSVVSYHNGVQPEVIVNQDGSRTTPSIIALKGGERKVGAAAKRQQVVNPKETVSIIKRFMGLKYDDPDCQKAIKHVTYKIVNENNQPRVEIEGKKYSPEELSSYILNHLKKAAEEFLGEEVKQAIVTCPAYFNSEQREATKLAGELCGLEVLRVISEPTAALLASGLDLKTEKKILVADVGSGTTDFSVAEVSNELVEIKASYGDMFLGGSDFDLKIAAWLTDEFKKENGIDLNKDVQSKQRIIEASEKAKCELSSSSQTEINLPYITATPEGPLHLVKALTRSQFEKLISKDVDKVVKFAKKAVSDAGIASSELDGILLVGGSCRIPIIQERLEKELGTKLYKSANLDEAVSLGAAVQANILGGGNSDILLLDVTPLTLSIETMGGVATKMIEANTTIPCKKSNIFSTAVDNQPSVTIRVCQGERPIFADNKVIGQFNLDNIPPAKRGVPQIEVAFDISANGILSVSAKDLGTGKDAHITIEHKSGLSDADIERMKNEAKEFAAEDNKKKEVAEKLNKIDSLIFNAEKQLDEYGEKLTEDEKATITTQIGKMKLILTNKEYEKVDDAEKEFNAAWIPISGRLYSQAGGDGKTTSNPFEGMKDNPFGGFDFTKGAYPNSDGNEPPQDGGGDDIQDGEEVK
jgi:molecular chaperone DnaK